MKWYIKDNTRYGGIECAIIKKISCLEDRSEYMRTLVATALSNAKGKDIFCKANKVTDQHVRTIRNTDRKLLEEVGFTFIKMLSLEYPNVRGYVIFFEGHFDEMVKALKLLEKGY